MCDKAGQQKCVCPPVCLETLLAAHTIRAKTRRCRDGGLGFATPGEHQNRMIEPSLKQ